MDVAPDRTADATAGRASLARECENASRHALVTVATRGGASVGQTAEPTGVKRKRRRAGGRHGAVRPAWPRDVDHSWRRSGALEPQCGEAGEPHVIRHERRDHVHSQCPGGRHVIGDSYAAKHLMDETVALKP